MSENGDSPSLQEKEQIKIYQSERQQIKAALARFETFLDRYSNEKIVNLELRLKTVESTLLREFSEVQAKLELVDSKEILSGEREAFEDLYYDLVGKAIAIIRTFYDEKPKPAQVQSADTKPVHNVVSNRGFPAIELIKFYGDYDKWSQFRDLFKTLIHNDTSIDKIRKFYYLLSSLKGEASKVLESIQVTEENYDMAWDMLIERFENTNLTIKNHVKAIFELPTVSKDKCSLRSLLDEFQKRFRALKLLNEPVESWSTMLIHLLTSKLDFRTSTQWEEFVITQKLSKPNIQNLIDFLSDRCRLLETSNVQFKNEHTAPGGSNIVKPYHSRRSDKPSDRPCYKNQQSYATQLGKGFNNECFFCKERHFVYQCKKLSALPVAERIKSVENRNLCLNCLRSNHILEKCLAQGCKVCGKRHNTLFHIDQSSDRVTTNATEVSENNIQTAGLLVNHSVEQQNEILLSTATVLIKDKNHKWHECRALLDSGSQSNFITKNLAEKLNLPVSKVDIPIVGIGTAPSKITQQINAKIKSSDDTSYQNDISFLVINKITENLPSISFKKSIINFSENIILADKNYNISKPVDILLGVTVFYEILYSEKIILGKNLPILQHTSLGWVISGSLPIYSKGNRACNLSISSSIEQQIEKFWKLEEYTPKTFYTAEETQCEKIFTNTLNRESTTGQFIVNLPISENAKPIGDSLDAAVKRLKSIERKFQKNPEFKQQYTNFMLEYENLGHMRKVDPQNIKVQNTGQNIFYLPHHGVLNKSSTTTALRVVFDGSCPSSSGTALNDILMTGPTIQDDLFSILIRFRKHVIVILADVAKMYRQIKVNTNQTDLQRIVWRENATDQISHYQLLTVTYGTAPASYLATRALQQTAFENKQRYPLSSDVILRDFYVDDLITGTNTVQEAVTLKNEITQILSEYGFNLRKWVSNNCEVVSKINCENNDKYYVHENEFKKALGLVWHAKLDFLTYTVKDMDLSGSNQSLTKRSILSNISSIFDPLGLMSPIIIRAKLLIQLLWQLKKGWDEPLPQNMGQEWLNLTKELTIIDAIKIKRQVVINNVKSVELHCFCDASQTAYGTCIYLRSIDHNNTCKSYLLCSKSRVAPLKTISIPRLELCGAVLAVNLYEKVQKALDLKVDNVFFWTDSTIVLGWLSLSPSKLKIFVANRVAEIQNKSDINQWSHVSTTENPADLVSRGVKVEELKNSKMWWYGPDWLQELDTSLWAKQYTIPSEIPEIKQNKIVSTTVVKNHLNIFNKYSTLYRLLRIIAYCLRFAKNCKTKTRVQGNLTLDEINNSINILLILAQHEMFPNFNTDNCNNSNIKSLNPIIGPDGLLRVGGRLNKSDLPYEAKHQIILMPKHPLTKLIILNEHHRHLHAGILTILSSLRQKYWIIHGRRAIRSILTNCITCFKVKPRPIVAQMGDLPVDRITKNRPFLVTGVDFAGPFNIKDGKTRNRKIVKAYLCIFICFSTKAVHLEAVGDLSSKSFLNALQRFVSRRGLCKKIYSDNGTNFTGANHELLDIHKNIAKFVSEPDIADYLLKNSMCWHFIPPRSPHHGGLWEAAVKRAKFHLNRIIGKTPITFEELSTFFAQVEAAINSAPITPISSDPSDLSCLTPGHFLIGEPLLSLPQHDMTELQTNRLSQFQTLQQMFQVFWKKWSRDYLLNLQQRTKWQSSPTEVLQPGSLVLLIEENLPPMYWRMGRVLTVHPGEDQVIRVVSVKTANGVFKRAVQKLCLLPFEKQNIN